MVHQRWYQRHRWQICHRCQRHRRQIVTGINDTGGNLPTVSTTPVANFAIIFPCVVDTGGKFATGVNDTGGKFAAGVKLSLFVTHLQPLFTVVRAYSLPFGILWFPNPSL
jgi:hypothetical protein